MATPQDMERLLRQTLEDRKLSAPERVALSQVLAESHLDSQKVAALRATAFALARESAFDPVSREVIGWLEDVVKLLHPVKPGVVASEVLFAPFDDLPARVSRVFGSAKRSADLCVFTI